jgi:hypothetical protein
MKKIRISEENFFQSLGWGAWGPKREKRREKILFFFQKGERRDIKSVVLKKVTFFLFSHQNVIVRERNDAFLYLSRETVSV